MPGMGTPSTWLARSASSVFARPGVGAVILYVAQPAARLPMAVIRRPTVIQSLKPFVQ